MVRHWWNNVVFSVARNEEQQRGTSYIRWGRKICEGSATLVYKGIEHVLYEYVGLSQPSIGMSFAQNNGTHPIESPVMYMTTTQLSYVHKLITVQPPRSTTSSPFTLSSTFILVANNWSVPFVVLLLVSELVAWSSGRASVFGRCASTVLRSACSWWVITYVGKPSYTGQPTRPTQPFILSGSINE